MKQRSYNTKHRVKELIDQGYGTCEIAEKLGCSRVNVWQLMRRHNLDEGTRKMMDDTHIYSTVTRKNEIEARKRQQQEGPVELRVAKDD